MSQQNTLTYHFLAFIRSLRIAVETGLEMTTAKQHFPSFASTISALGIVLYCVGFLRVELEFKNQKKRLKSLENVPKSIDLSSSGPNVKVIKNPRSMYFSHYLDSWVSPSILPWLYPASRSFSLAMAFSVYQVIRVSCLSRSWFVYVSHGA